MKLLIRGGGIAAGKGARISYGDLLTESLLTFGVEVINRSRDRDTTFEGTWTFYEDIDPFNPEIILLHFAIDDIYRPVYRSEFKENLVQIVRLSRVRFNPEIFLLTSHYFNNEHEMQAALIYYRAIREVSLDLDCHLIPAHYLLAHELDNAGLALSDILCEDDRYLNDLGHHIFHAIVYEKITSSLFSHVL